MPDSPSPESTLPAGEQQTAPPAGDDAASSEQDYIRLNRKELSAEIKRLQSEDPEFLQVFNSHVGERATREVRRKYEPEIAARDSRIAELQIELRRQEIAAMTPEEIEEKFDSDPDFAVEYAKIVHTKPQTAIPDEAPRILAAWNAMVEWAESKGVPESKITEVTAKAANGSYTQDGAHWSVALQRVQGELTEELLKNVKPAASASSVNPELVKGGPDLTPGDHQTQTSFQFKTAAEFNKLPIDEQRSILKTPEGKEYVMTLAKKG